MKLTNQQKKAAENYQSSTSIVADAGSGKTRVLTEYYKYLVAKKNIKAFKILTFTFTEKAAFEIEERIAKENLIPHDQKTMFNISTIHSFCLKILKQYGYQINLSPEFNVLSEVEEKLQTEEIIFVFLREKIEQEDDYILKLIKLWGYQKLFNIFVKLLNIAYLLEDLSLQNSFSTQQNELLDLIQIINQKWLKTKIKNHQLTFLDLEYLAVDLLKNHHSIRSELQKRFEYILVDEFQDTNHLQANLVQYLFNEKYNKLFMVGDPKQSIYRFRQASLEVFFKTQELIRKKNGLAIQLKETFRMGHKICELINKIFQPLFLENSQYQYQPMTSLKESSSDYQLIIHPHSENNIDTKRKIEAHFIAQKIKELIYQNQSPHEIALLFRSSSQMEIYQKTLKDYDIPTSITKTSSLLLAKEVILIIQILKYILNPEDKLNQIAILKSPYLNIDESIISTYLNENDLTKLSEKVFFRYQNFQKIIDQTKEDQKILSGYFVIEKLLASLRNFEQQYEILISDETINKRSQLLSIIKNIQESHVDIGFESIVEKIIKLKTSHQRINSIDKNEKTGVQLLTIHASKGLEFDYVFLPNLYSQTRPDQRDFVFDEEIGIAFKKESLHAKGLKIELEEDENYLKIKEIVKKNEREESKRLLYVAMTRVKKELFLFLEEKNSKKKIAIHQINNWNDWILNSFDDDEKNFHYLDDEFNNQLETLSNKDQTTTIYPKNFDKNIFIGRKPTLTTSAIETFYRCEKEYQLKYLQSIKAVLRNEFSPSNLQHSSISASQKGNLLHEIFQFLDFKNFSNQNTVIDQALINQRIYQHKEEIIKEIEMILHKIKKNEKLLSLMNQSEKSLTELSFLIDLNEFYLKGTIDRIMLDKDQVIILDFKTEKITSPAKIKERIQIYQTQLLAYALASYQTLNLSNILIALYFTDIDFLFVEKINLTDLNIFKEKIIEDYLKLIDPNYQFHFTQNKNFCNRCEYFERNYCGINDDN